MNIAEFFGLVAASAWMAFIGIVILIGLRAGKNQPVKGLSTLVLVVLVLAVVLSVVSAGIKFIQPEERGVVLSAVQPQGYREQALEPGLRWIIPFAENVVLYPISKQIYTMSDADGAQAGLGDESVAARTSDGQQIYLDASVIFSIDPARIVDVHIAWQGRYDAELVRPLARGIIRDAVSQYGVEQVVSSKRFDLVNDIERALESRLADNGLILQDFVLRNITFSPEYAASVEQKQIAEQQAQQAKFVVESKRQEAEQARQVAQGSADAVVIAAEGQGQAWVIQATAEAEARIIQAEAEAKALELVAAVLAENPDLLTYQYITKLSPNVQVMFLPSNAPFLFPLPDLNIPQ
jgi:regulator of protease activity HflC (stomatin/prohibitin superfamily)